MAIYLKVLWSLRQLVVLMNALIVLVMVYGFWRFLSQDGMTEGWGWLLAIPMIGLFLIGPPLFTSIAIFTDNTVKLKIIFLLLNLIILIILFAGLFADKWITATNEMSFSIKSLAQTCLLFGAPFLINVMTLSVLLLPKKRDH